MFFYCYFYQNKCDKLRNLQLFLLIIFSQFVTAQEPYSINYSINEGLPTSTIYSVYQDDLGYLWFTTDVGVIKYDSHTFKLMNTDDGLSDNEVFQMKKDSKGRIWLLTLSGKLTMLFKNKIYTEANSEFIKKVNGSSITVDFFEDDKQNLYICYRNGEIAIILAQNKVIKKTINIKSIAGIYVEKGSTYFVEPKGLLNLEKNKFLLNSTSFQFHKIHHSKQGTLFSFGETLYSFDQNKSVIKVIELPKNQEILHCSWEIKNKIWLCTRDGLYQIENGKIKNHYLKGIPVSYIIKDFEGSYWVTTLKNGIIHIPSFDVKIDKLGNPDRVKLNSIEINNKKEIWLGGENNDYYIKKADQPAFTKHLLFDAERMDKIPNIRFFNSDTYVIGKLNVKKISANGKEQNLKFSANDILIKGDQTYVGYTYTYNIPTKKILDLFPGYRDQKTFMDKRTNVFCNGVEDAFWIGSNSGLYSFSKKDSIINWGEIHKNLETIIEDVYYDSSTNTTLVASASKGLIVILNNKIKHLISKKSGLNSNTCNAIKKVAPNYYLVGTNYGLNSIELNNNSYQVKNLNSILGIQNIKVWDLDFLENKVYLATENGLLYFNLNKINNPNVKPLCNILEFKAKNKIINNNAVIEFKNRDISILFSGVSYINKGNLSYFYKLNNDDWTSSSESKINFKSLASGKYTFSVYCVDANGIKSEVKSINFEIATPFWQKWWFITLLIFAAALLISGFIKYRLKIQKGKFEKEKAQIQLEKQLVELEQKALRMQMNPHFIFNALNTIKGYYTEGNLVQASSYISKFSKLLRKLLESEEQTTTLKNEIEMLQLYIEITQIRYEDKFDFSFQIDKNLNPENVLIPNLLLQPFVENAIIHGLSPKTEKGNLKIEFKIENAFLVCLVDDDGIGRKKAETMNVNKEHESKALAITTERLNLFDSKSGLEIIDKYTLEGNSLGTQVIIKLPIKNTW